MGSCGFIRELPVASGQWPVDGCRLPVARNAAPGRHRPGNWSLATDNSVSSYIQKDLLYVHQVLQIEQPAQDHLDREREHGQEEVGADVVTGRAHLLEEAAEGADGHDR